ncbi:DoxX family membrane protein [Streptomyces sp. NBC_01762]|uniref:DoxX family protein n=1 Tax=Streptomyces sp. NBC_01762 TaxID=2975933 RepID=UPI002DD82C69|nr:DoxX family membrane protein [Streptomyces sp. NBC_01762]WSC49323.1 DoxX family membrane protein [Streptomyces sp. NBC_01762]
MSRQFGIGSDLGGRMDGIDVARYGLRAVVGGTMIAHGLRHGSTLDGTAQWFRSVGFRGARLQAAASAAVEVGAGAALLAGVATPLAASAVVGTMGVAARSVHLPHGFFVTDEGYEYVLNLGAAAVALAALGPGRLSVDRALGMDGRLGGRRGAAFAAGFGLAAAAVQLGACWRRPRPGTADADPADGPARTRE